MIVVDPRLVEEPIAGSEPGFDGEVLHFFNETLERIDPFAGWHYPRDGRMYGGAQSDRIAPGLEFRTTYPYGIAPEGREGVGVPRSISTSIAKRLAIFESITHLPDDLVIMPANEDDVECFRGPLCKRPTCAARWSLVERVRVLLRGDP